MNKKELVEWILNNQIYQVSSNVGYEGYEFFKTKTEALKSKKSDLEVIKNKILQWKLESK